MKTRPVIIALSAFVAAAGLTSLLSLLVLDVMLPPLRFAALAGSGALLLAGAVALFQQRRLAAPLLAGSALLYGVQNLYEPVARAGLDGFAEASVEFMGSLVFRLLLALAAYLLVRRARAVQP